jgi:hypothetical protein
MLARDDGDIDMDRKRTFDKFHSTLPDECLYVDVPQLVSSDDDEIPVQFFVGPCSLPREILSARHCKKFAG